MIFPQYDGLHIKTCMQQSYYSSKCRPEEKGEEITLKILQRQRTSGDSISINSQLIVSDFGSPLDQPLYTHDHKKELQ